jgi:murein DD-endopeptidase MepM/ murein hydrolase activator NlpD
MIRHRICLYRAAGFPASFRLDFTIPGKFLGRALCLLVVLGFSACEPAPPSSSPHPALRGEGTVSRAPTPTNAPIPGPEEATTATLQPTLVPATPTFLADPPLCSPLDGIKSSDLAIHIVNPFRPPRPGSDDPHQGVDLADLVPGSGVARPGLSVRAVLAGRVASVIRDRFPYGNAILIETPLEDLPAAWQEALPVPTLEPTLPARSALTCPTPQAPPAWNLAQRSLYLLYAHMQQAPTLKPEEPVSCGEGLGLIGSTGNALNPHLHLEARVGPAGADFPSMAHYDASASPQEMRAYCDWRVSGLFQLIDPMRIFIALH